MSISGDFFPLYGLVRRDRCAAVKQAVGAHKVVLVIGYDDQVMAHAFTCWASAMCVKWTVRYSPA